MRTQEQQQASRINGAKSRGPVTPEGKARSAQNRITHGLYSNHILLRCESREAWVQLQEELIADLKPASQLELKLVHDLAVSDWLGRRALLMQTALINLEYDNISADSGPSQDDEDEIERAAIAYAHSIGRDEAVHELARQHLRYGRQWIRLHSKLTSIQNTRKAEEAGLAFESAPPPEAPATQQNLELEPEAPPAPRPVLVRLPASERNTPASQPTLAPTGTADSRPDAGA